MKGRNSMVISIRVTDEIYGLILEQAEKRGVSVGEFVRGKVEAYAHSVNTIKAEVSVNTIKRGENVPSGVYPLYNPAVHKVGDKVLMRQGKRLVLAVVPELDGDGHEVPV